MRFIKDAAKGMSGQLQKLKDSLRPILSESARSERNRFENIVKTLSEGLIISDRHGIAREVNQAALDMFGITGDDMIGKPCCFEEFTIVDETGMILGRDDLFISHSLGDDRTFKNVIRGLKRPDGTALWFKVSITPVFNPEKELEEVVSVITDITELYDLKKRDQKVLETAKEGYWEVRLSGEIIKVNKSLSDILGYGKDELVGKTVYDVADEDSKTALGQVLENLKQGIPENCAVTLRHRKGTDVYTMVSASPFLDSSGKAIGAFAFITDLSDLIATHRELERQHNMISAINRAIVSYVRSDNIKEPIEHILGTALALTNSEYGAVASVHDEGDRRGLKIISIKGARWADDRNRELYDRAMQQYFSMGYISCPFMDNLFGMVIRTKKPVISNSADDPCRKGVPEGHMPLNSFMGVPFMWHDRVMGMIAVANREGGYTEYEFELVEAMARSISLILYREEERMASLRKDHILNLIASFSRDLARAVSETEAYEIFKHYLLSLRKGEGIDAIYLVSTDPGKYFAEDAIRYNNSGLAEAGKFPGVDKCRAYLHAGTFTVKDLSRDCACPFQRLEAQAGSSCCTAIDIGGSIAGVLHLYSRSAGSFTDDMKETIDSFISLLAPVINNIRLLEMNRKLALIDPLTGLYNRRYMEAFMDKHLALAERNNQLLSIIMFDIDNFKTFNDTYGHEAGDMALESISQAISRSIRSSDIGVRYGGEEFIVVLPNTDKMTALEVAERIRIAIETAPLRVSPGRRAFVTASFGVATYGTDAGSLDAMIARADTALYNAKKTGKNRTCIWQE